MKNIIKIIIIVLFMTISTNVFADYNIPYRFTLINGEPSVLNGTGVVEDYSDLIDYSDGVLTIHEGVNIASLEFDSSLEITSNDKEVMLGSVHGTGTNAKQLIIKNLNSIDRESGVYIYSQNTSLEVTDSSIYGFTFQSGTKYDYRDSYISIKNSHIYRASDFEVAGNITIEDSEITGQPYIRTALGNIVIRNSEVGAFNMLLSYFGYYDIKDSTLNITNQINDTQYYSELINMPYDDRVHSFENTNITVPCFVLSGNYNDSMALVLIKDCVIDVAGYVELGHCLTTFENSTINVRGGWQSYGVTFKNSTLVEQSYIYNNDYPLIIDNSDIHYNYFLRNTGEATIDSSYIEGAGSFGTHAITTISDSYLNIVGKNGPDSYNFAFDKKVILHNTRLYLVNTDDDYPLMGLTTNSELVLDDGVVITDKDDNELYYVQSNVDGFTDSNPVSVFYYDQDGTNYSRSIKYIPVEKVTFKVVNGTWNDGTSDDIVISKDSWEKLNSDEIPVGMIAKDSCGNGSWDEIPLAETVIKKDVTYTYSYTCNKVKGVEEITENPKTGLVDYSIKCLLLLSVMIIIYLKVYNKSFFKKY